MGRPSIAPEMLLRAMLLQAFYSIRSERQLMEQTQYNLLFRWFIGLSMDDSVWVPTVFTKNRERLIEHDAVVAFFNEVLKQADKTSPNSGVLGQGKGDSLADRQVLLRRVLTGLHQIRALDSSIRKTLAAKAAIVSIALERSYPEVLPRYSAAVADAVRPGLWALLSSSSGSTDGDDTYGMTGSAMLTTGRAASKGAPPYRPIPGRARSK